MSVLYFFIRAAVAFPVSFVLWLVVFFGLAVPFWPSVGLALLGGAIAYGGLQWYMNFSTLKAYGLTRREYTYIRKNLKDAKDKINRIQKAFIHIRSISTFTQMLRINRLVKRIYNIVKKEPKRFYQAERFFFYHLDSVVELTEKHAFLAAQPIKDADIDRSLRETRDTIEQLIKKMEDDLYRLVSTDVEHLTFELDVAKHALNKWTPPEQERSSHK